jgi:small subunit ribosomal protein S6
MRNYEVTFIVDPLLSSDEIQGTATNYIEHLENQGANIVHREDMGLRQLAYPIKKRNSGMYYSIEFAHESGQLIPNLELALQRDGRIIRFLTVALDKHGVKFNEDKRNGLIGNRKEENEESEPADTVKASSDKEPEPKNQPSTDSEE